MRGYHKQLLIFQHLVHISQVHPRHLDSKVYKTMPYTLPLFPV
jgi:hypothetical protein